jgi:hypothetical protein
MQQGLGSFSYPSGDYSLDWFVALVKNANPEEDQRITASMINLDGTFMGSVVVPLTTLKGSFVAILDQVNVNQTEILVAGAAGSAFNIARCVLTPTSSNCKTISSSQLTPAQQTGTRSNQVYFRTANVWFLQFGSEGNYHYQGYNADTGALVNDHVHDVLDNSYVFHNSNTTDYAYCYGLKGGVLTVSKWTIDANFNSQFQVVGMIPQYTQVIPGLAAYDFLEDGFLITAAPTWSPASYQYVSFGLSAQGGNVTSVDSLGNACKIGDESSCAILVNNQ